jgi:sulfur carrier protein ThiS
MSHSKNLWFVLFVFALFPALLLAGNPSSKYSVLSPISSGNLTIYPVTSSMSHNTSSFMTLDEGIRNGTVVVTESGQVAGLIRRPGQRPVRSAGAEVNRLVLLNNSDRPLLLLAGEIVTGGKQDRVIGSDRIVPPKSDPVDLSVFCVEPGRWVARSEKFGYMGSQMAQLSIRAPAMNEKSQTAVWDNVRESSRNAAKAAPSAAPVIAGTTSYAGVMQNKDVRDKLETVSAPIERDYSKLMHQLKQQNAVGVVVAVNGQIVWADLFASTELLEDYWPKLIRSYAAEALTGAPRKSIANQYSAQDFIDSVAGNREIVETEPGVYRRAEITGDGYKVFSLTSLLPKTDFTVHLAKMSDDTRNHVVPMIE